MISVSLNIIQSYNDSISIPYLFIDLNKTSFLFMMRFSKKGEMNCI